jgi:uroporphyrinogen-III synthase
VDRFVGALRDGRALGRARLAVVGAVTAQALADRHLVADLVAEEETAEGLVAAMPAAPSGDAAPGRVLFPRAVGARDVVGPGLRQKGWDVIEVDAYRTVASGEAQGVGGDALDAASRADVVTFTSPSTVTGYADLAGSRRVPPVVACIGPVTAEAARRAGFEVDVVAAEHSVEGLVAALSAFLGPDVAPSA